MPPTTGESGKNVPEPAKAPPAQAFPTPLVSTRNN